MEFSHQPRSLHGRTKVSRTRLGSLEASCPVKFNVKRIIYVILFFFGKRPDSQFKQTHSNLDKPQETNKQALCSRQNNANRVHQIELVVKPLRLIATWTTLAFQKPTMWRAGRVTFPFMKAVSSTILSTKLVYLKDTDQVKSSSIMMGF